MGDDYVWSAVIKSGALGEHGGVTSDHTLQQVDLSMVKLFGTDHIPPMARCQREFTLAYTKKFKFKESVQEQHDHHKLESMLEALADNFLQVNPSDKNGSKFRALVSRYNNIDELVKSTLRHAATSVGHKNMGYQRSPELIHSIKQVLLWKAVLKCVRRENHVLKSMAAVG